MITVEQIKQEIREFLALSEKATSGPWLDDDDNNIVADKVYVLTCIGQITSIKQDAHNTAFIARSRNISPVMAKALLEAIEGLENSTPEDEGRFNSASFALREICRTWEESK